MADVMDDLRTQPRAHAGENRRTATAALVIIAGILSVTAFTFLSKIIFPVIIALFLYYIIRPTAEAMIAVKIPPWVAYLILFLTVMILFVLLGQVVYLNGLAFRDKFPEYQQRLLAIAGRVAPDKSSGTVTSTLREFLNTSSQEIFLYVAGTAFTFLELALVVFFYLLFIILNAEKVSRRMQRAFNPDTADSLLRMGRSVSDGIQQYMKVKTRVSLGMACVAGIIMYCFNLEYWPLWVFLAFILNYITYVGSIAALIPPIALAYLQFDSIWTASLLAICVTANRFFWIDYIEVRASGKQLNLDPVLLLVSLAYWGWFGGVLGLLLAVPMLTCLKIGLAQFDRTRRWALLISEE